MAPENTMQRHHSLDRISEVYKGGVWSDHLTNVARERIHWLCDQTIGPQVLDVGCSQGVTSILLGQRGYECIGIDIQEEAISFARRDLEQQENEVRRRVKFETIEFCKYSPKKKFNAIVMGEVLEHLTEPRKFIEHAIHLLEKDGRIVITTPFGFMPHDDHDQEIFPSWFTEFSEIGVSVSQLTAKDGYIRAILGRHSEVKNEVSLNDIITETEEGALASQRWLHRIIKNKTSSYDREIKDRNREIKDRDREIKDRDREIKDRDREIKDRDREIKDRDRKIMDRDRYIQDCQRRLVEILLAQHNLQSKAEEDQGRKSFSKKTYRWLANAVDTFLQKRNLEKELINDEGLPEVELIREFRAASVSGILPLASKKDAEIETFFLKDGPVVLQNQIVGDETYLIRGKLTSLRGTRNDRGVLLFVEVRDKRGKLVTFESSHIHRFQFYNCGIGYVVSGPTAQFCVAVTLPKEAFHLKVGFRTLKETGMVNLLIDPAKKVSALKRKIAESGVSKFQRGDALRRADRGTSAARSLAMPIILDDFTYECLAPEVELTPISKKCWKAEISKIDNPFAFFVESAWRGNEGEWKYAINQPAKWGAELGKCIDYCRDHSIPTLFWNKEDPINFEAFIEAAKKFEHIFTTDSGSIERYNEITGKKNAHLLQFAAQSGLHNPIRIKKEVKKLAFTGSWRGVKYPVRAEWIDALLTPAMEMEVLDIYDRYAGEKTNADLIFPEKFEPVLRGALPYQDLVSDVYKSYYGFINVNSVENSETMLSRRVFEMIACGAPVISSPSEAIEKTFGDIVLMPSNKKEAQDYMLRLLNESVWRDSLATRGVRLVHSEHTYTHRLEQIAEVIGKPAILRAAKKVSIICCSKRPRFLKHVAEQVGAQTHKEFELIFVKHSSDMQDNDIDQHLGHIKNLVVLKNDDHNVLADGLNQAITKSEYDFLAKWDDDDYYGPNYLKDSLLAFDYAPHAGVVGKGSYFTYVQSRDATYLRFPGKHYKNAKIVHGGTLLWDRRKTNSIIFTRRTQGTDTIFLKDCINEGVPILSTDQFNFVHVRYADTKDHTWKIKDEEFLQKTNKFEDGLALSKIYV
ncbi:3-demethylubiquinone-9 3-methyltransferase [Roseibium album]|nr:3-demethylubiquinone-9 3-methyltransferase [Roseibium album]